MSRSVIAIMGATCAGKTHWAHKLLRTGDRHVEMGRFYAQGMDSKAASNAAFAECEKARGLCLVEYSGLNRNLTPALANICHAAIFINAPWAHCYARIIQRLNVKADEIFDANRLHGDVDQAYRAGTLGPAPEQTMVINPDAQIEADTLGALQDFVGGKWDGKTAKKEPFREVLTSGRTKRDYPPEQVRAWQAVANALRSGKIKRTPCQICGGTDKLEAHHANHLRPLDVTFFCHSCHDKHFTKPIYRSNRKRP